jgi:hypothetical protein
MIKKTTKAVEPASKEASKIVYEYPNESLPPAPMVWVGLRFLRKKNGSMILQEGVNGVWVDVPMEIEQ